MYLRCVFVSDCVIIVMNYNDVKGEVDFMKQAFKIPYDLDASYGDMEIAIQGKDGVGLKPLPVKVILTYVFSGLVCFYVCSNSFISRGSLLQIVLFVLLWSVLTIQLARFDKTKRMQAQLIPVFMEYLPKRNRFILTRTSKTATPFMGIAGVLDIDDNGLVSRTDGTFEYWYRVVGSASILLFEDDRNAILQRVDSFYRKIGTDVEVSFLTSKESQKVHHQIANLKRKFDRLTVSDPDLLKVADEQFHILRDHVGGSFKSIHQYMILKGDNKEALTVAKNVLQSEVENSALMIKQCVPMFKHDINEPLRLIYKGKE